MPCTEVRKFCYSFLLLSPTWSTNSNILYVRVTLWPYNLHSKLSFQFLDGTLYSWGSDDYGQLGLGPASVKDKIVCEPKVVKSLIGVPIGFIACGGYHSFAISKTGKFLTFCSIASLFAFLNNRALFAYVNACAGVVYGWGKNSFGQLGLNHVQNQNIPSVLKTLKTVKMKFISCGEDFSVFLTEVVFSFSHVRSKKKWWEYFEFQLILTIFFFFLF